MTALSAGPSAGRLVALRAVLVALVLVTGACSTGNDDNADDAPLSAIVTPGPLADGADEDGTPERPLEGRGISRFALEVGMCFNEYTLTAADTGETSDFTTAVDCRREHDGEVYAQHIHPADASVPFPGRTELTDWGVKACYADFAGFVGEVYELSRLEIGVIVPEEEDWLAGPFRTITCHVRAPDGELLAGSMQDTGL